MAADRTAPSDPAEDAPALEVAVTVASPAWEAALPGAAARCRAAAAAAVAVAGLGAAAAEISVLLTDDAEMARRNRRYRGRRGATNVLAFPGGGPAPEARTGAPPLLLGDVAVGFETVAREAAAWSLPLGDHLAHMVVHGVLHLVGHDHEAAAAAAAMEALETAALGRLGVADPYAAAAAAR